MEKHCKCIIQQHYSVKSSWASSCVNSLKCSDASRTNSVLIFRVVGGEWWPGVLWPSICIWLGQRCRAEHKPIQWSMKWLGRLVALGRTKANLVVCGLALFVCCSMLFAPLPKSDTNIGLQDTRPPFTTYNPEDETTRLAFVLPNGMRWPNHFIDHQTGSHSALRRCLSQIQILGHKTPGHHSPPTTLKMRTQLVLETSEHFSELTQLLAREDFTEFSRCENIKTYNSIIIFTHKEFTYRVKGVCI